MLERSPPLLIDDVRDSGVLRIVGLATKPWLFENDRAARGTFDRSELAPQLDAFPPAVRLRRGRAHGSKAAVRKSAYGLTPARNRQLVTLCCRAQGAVRRAFLRKRKTNAVAVIRGEPLPGLSEPPPALPRCRGTCSLRL